MKEQCTYDFLVGMNKGGVASLRGTVKDENGRPIAGATIESADKKYTATTNDKGRYNITSIEAGDYNFTVLKEGFIRLQRDTILKPAQSNTLDIVLKPVMQMVA